MMTTVKVVFHCASQIIISIHLIYFSVFFFVYKQAKHFRIPGQDDKEQLLPLTGQEQELLQAPEPAAGQQQQKQLQQQQQPGGVQEAADEAPPSHRRQDGGGGGGGRRRARRGFRRRGRSGRGGGGLG